MPNRDDICPACLSPLYPGMLCIVCVLEQREQEAEMCAAGEHDWQYWICIVGWHWRKCRRCGYKENRDGVCDWRKSA